MNVGTPGAGAQDFELNLASIIDCFTVLITFMLASASFLSLGILDAGVAAAGNSPNPTPPPAVNVTVELKPGHTLIVKVNGKENTSLTFNEDGKSKDWNYDAMNSRLTEIKTKWPAVSALTLTADNTIEYKEVIKSMEAIRKTVPVVLLGGF